MEYNSFYGGRRGASFIIVKNYKTIAEMIEAFKQGGNYKVVNYDEIVMIDTADKNDKDNGKIYKRGYNYQNEMGGAEYLGQIVGPSGPAPQTELTTIENVKAIAEKDGFDYLKGEGQYAPTDNLIPGKYLEQGQEKYNDSISWAYCSVRDKDAHDSIAYVGFKIPYTVIDYDAESVDPYYNRDSNEANFKNLKLTERIDDATHPFYEKWKIKVPKGIKGDSLKNLKVMIASKDIEPYPGQEDDIAHKREVLVYEYHCHDVQENGAPTLLYLGAYNMIKNISLSEDGTFKIQYTHDSDVVYSKVIKWIKDISLNVNNGQFLINYNNGTSYNTQLIYPTSVKVDGQTGVFTMIFTDGHRYVENFKYPNNVTINTGAQEGEGNQKINIAYTDNTNKDIGFPINYVMKMACSGATGFHVYILYSDPAKRAQGPKVTYEGRDDWTDLGFIGTGDIGSITARADDPGAAALAEKLPPYSSWFIIEDEK